ncbi:uncharacterized protein LOC117785144 [Drosophila innubila]|uniref:uncharacterized protein LOC117785144 n=1 Tax=Drosophila innubila TaxID=198719 RepID=UPI00148BB67C|nr:uncharacterized protein LOC117785144 [Drosophila innubila]
MDHNEISMCMDVKLDTHDKRAIALRYKSWTRCQVKIEAIKCVPCFLRLSFQSLNDDEPQQQPQQPQQHKLLSISVNVPGVNISLATSRTKQHSYGLFWTQNRRDCFIYFALETETACRRHMKWIKKSIKNLELYRQVFLEQRRLSRDTSQRGPLPNLPDSLCFELDANSFNFSARVSQIYEEIFDGSRISRASIASGIYEEMNLTSANAARAILEMPPALPPLPAHRKRINTFECQPGEIPRSSTNPESELAKKKKYKNMLDNIFGQKRRSGSASVDGPPPERDEEREEQQPQQQLPLYENAPTPETAPPRKRTPNIKNAQRNSFSSPDLSKLNFLDTFGEALSSEELNISLEDSAIEDNSRQALLDQITRHVSRADSLESLNVSEQLPHNFNFSACNTSTINLIGSNGAVSVTSGQLLQAKKKKVLVDDLNGYCVMAPIIQKIDSNGEVALEKKPSASTASTSSGYSTGSYSSSTSSCNTDEQTVKISAPAPVAVALEAHNESDIYEPMHVNSLNSHNSILADHLYENLLAFKASQELEGQPLGLGYGLSTSTPTESPLLPALPPKQQTPTTDQREQLEQEEEDYYQTPRKSIISVDDKIPSYYPNSCDTLKSKRRSPSSADAAAPGMRHLVSARLRRERKENLYISSPQQIIEQRQKTTATLCTNTPTTTSTSSSSSLAKTKTLNKKTAAHKISEGVYAVTHATKRISHNNNNNNNNNNQNDIQAAEEELLQLAMLQNIDFKFDDGKASEASSSNNPNIKSKTKSSQLEDEYEHCYQAAERATRMLQKYATLAKFGNSPTKQQQQQQLPLKPVMTQSQSPNELQQQQQQVAVAPVNSLKKFASLPRFRKIDFSPLKLRLNNVLQRNPTAAPQSPQ